MAVIHSFKGIAFTLTGELAVNRFLSNCFSSSMLISKKCCFQYVFFERYYFYFYRILAVIYCFKVARHFFHVKISSHPILPTLFQCIPKYQSPWNTLLIGILFLLFLLVSVFWRNDRSFLKCFTACCCRYVWPVHPLHETYATNIQLILNFVSNSRIRWNYCRKLCLGPTKNLRI